MSAWSGITDKISSFMDEGAAQFDAVVAGAPSRDDVIKQARDDVDSFYRQFVDKEEQTESITPEGSIPATDLALEVEPQQKHVRTEVSPSLLAHIKKREGEKLTVYRDSVRTKEAPKGYITAGVGHKLTAEEVKTYPEGATVKQEQVDIWLKADLAKAKEAAYTQSNSLGVPELENALVSVNFQMGSGWRSKFKKAWGALKDGRFDDAIFELEHSSDGKRESLWKKQSPDRVADFVAAIRSVQGEA
jgi:GH24 family phage-related lysozyme (muramidase)